MSDPIKTFSSMLRVPDGMAAQPWRPQLSIKNAEYLKLTELGGHGYTIDGLFHVFGPDGPVDHSLASWNAPEIWKRYLLEGFDWVAIAEDAFGHQFCLRPDARRPAIKMLSLWSGSFT